MEDYKVMIGEVRREWENPDPMMLCWLDCHQVGTKFRDDYDGYSVYEYRLDDGRKVWETYNIQEGKTILVAIEEV